MAHAGRKRVPLTTKRRLSPSAKKDRAQKVASTKKRRLDCATTVKSKTAPKDVAAEKTLILVPIATTASSAGGDQKVDGAPVEGAPAEVRSAPSSAPRYRAIAPKAEPKKILLPWVGIAPMGPVNCAAFQLKAALPTVALKEASAASVAPASDAQRATIFRVPTNSGADAQSAQTVAAARKPYTCLHCQQTFRRKCDIRRHMSVHSPRRLRANCAKSDDESSAPTRSRSPPKYGYCCDVCGRGYEKQREMLAHRRVYHETAPAMRWSAFQVCSDRLKQCASCGVQYSKSRFFAQHSCPDDEQEALLAQRAQEVSRAKPRYRCDVCSLCFAWKLIYRQHREVAHSERAPLDWDTVEAVEVAHYCARCFAAFDERTQVARHECADAEPEAKLKLYRCQPCGVSYLRRSSYRYHRRVKHGIVDEEVVGAEAQSRRATVRCPYCEKTAVKRSLILAHAKEAHGIVLESPYLCTVCQKVFKQKASFDTHNQTYHPRDADAAEDERLLREAQILVNGEPAYRCARCNRNWEDGVCYLAHHRLHLAERKYTCDQCGKQMRTQHQLGQHIKIIHLNVRDFVCDICRKSFHTKQSLEQHRRIHTGERPYSCEICGKTVISLNALISHKRIHTDFYPHACHLCPKKFKVRRSLVHHVRRHTGERPFRCELCSKTFNNSSLFSYHQKVTHSDNRPYKCDLCGSQFKANRFLTRHMKLHETRAHIQFKRRNNPEYFAAQDAAAAGSARGVKRAQHEADPNDDIDNIVISTVDAFAQPQSDLEIVEPGTG